MEIISNMIPEARDIMEIFVFLVSCQTRRFFGITAQHTKERLEPDKMPDFQRFTSLQFGCMPTSSILPIITPKQLRNWNMTSLPFSHLPLRISKIVGNRYFGHPPAIQRRSQTRWSRDLSPERQGPRIPPLERRASDGMMAGCKPARPPLRPSHASCSWRRACRSGV